MPKPHFSHRARFALALAATPLAVLPLLHAQAQTTSNTPRPTTPAPNVAAGAARYTLAVDQLAQGRTLEARVLLQEAIRVGGDRPEVNVLLAALLEREGRAGAARGVLGKVATSPLAAHQLARLKNVADGTTSADNRADTPQENASNAARSQAADARLSRLERSMAQMVNDARAEQELKPLQWSEDLSEIARGHSVEMRDKNYFAHESPTPGLTRPMDRYVKATGNTPRLIAENIYRAWGSRHQLNEADVRKGQESFLNSPGHRSNILLTGATRVGIGIAVNENGDIWITQLFDRPM